MPWTSPQLCITSRRKPSSCSTSKRHYRSPDREEQICQCHNPQTPWWGAWPHLCLVFRANRLYPVFVKIPDIIIPCSHPIYQNLSKMEESSVLYSTAMDDFGPRRRIDTATQYAVDTSILGWILWLPSAGYPFRPLVQRRRKTRGPFFVDKPEFRCG
jgi:hypothetical protein